jgi:hypothetical protein
MISLLILIWKMVRGLQPHSLLHFHARISYDAVGSDANWTILS